MPVPQRSQPASTDLDVHPLAGRIGAQVDNIQLAAGLPEATIAAIEAVLAKHKVIFFRDQGQLDDAEQESFAARLGDLVAHPTYPARPGSAAILELDSTDGRSRADRWHTDVTFVDAYPRLSVLRAVAVPPFGGDTVWANTVAAFDGLPPALKTLAENLWAVHSNLYDYAAILLGFAVFKFLPDGPQLLVLHSQPIFQPSEQRQLLVNFVEKLSVGCGFEA